MTKEINIEQLEDQIGSMVASRLLQLSQENLVTMRAIDKGLLLRSGRIGKDNTGYYVLYDAPYAKPVNFGTMPHAVSYKKLIGWVRRKLSIQDPRKAENVARAIAKKIQFHGTEPRPYMDKALADIQFENFEI